MIVGRFEEENEQIYRLSRNGDVQLELADNPGPLSILRGPYTEEMLRTAAATRWIIGR